jgi:pimeloyl-ACP methyl ester carboxylesterase
LPVTQVNGVDIAWERHGDAGDPAILLIQGLGLPAAAWPPAFIDLLLARGFSVVTFDNRDIGSSELLDHLGRARVLATALRRVVHLPIRPPYSLSDMAGDAEALLGVLGIDKAHVVGVSMGGMIAQNLALASPEKLASLTSIMSTTNDRDLPDAESQVRRFIVKGAADSSEPARRAYHRELWPLIGSPAYPHARDELEAFLDRIFEAGMPPSGRDRQTVAVLAEPGRGKRLGALSVPTLVIHGEADPLVPVACGRRTAACIPGARLRLFEGMGHDLPSALLPMLADEIVAHARAAGEASTRSVA